jgi:hypothetical protein
MAVLRIDTHALLSSAIVGMVDLKFVLFFARVDLPLAGPLAWRNWPAQAQGTNVKWALFTYQSNWVSEGSPTGARRCAFDIGSTRSKQPGPVQRGDAQKTPSAGVKPNGS